MPDLREVADQYEREARNAVRSSKVDRLRAMARSLRYIEGNRDAAQPDRLGLHHGLRVDLPTKWCRRHGYTATFGFDGIYFQRDGEPVQIASIGDTLLWDGRSIRVERAA